MPPGTLRAPASSAARPGAGARAHRRRGKIIGYLGDDHTFDRALERFAMAYADQNDADYAAFRTSRGRRVIEVERGV